MSLLSNARLMNTSINVRAISALSLTAVFLTWLYFCAKLWTPGKTVEENEFSRKKIDGFHLLKGLWDNTVSAWRDDDICHPDKVPNGCPSESMNSMSDKTRSSLNGKWIYFFGDSTMRQIARQLSNLFQNETISHNDDKAYFRQCPPQEGRIRYVAPRNDPAQCSLNEKRCDENLAYGETSLRWTVDWKHFIYEDYDDWLFLNVFPNMTDIGGKTVPDVMILSIGLHNCYHFEDLKWLPKHYRQVDAFFNLIVSATIRPKKVIFMDAGIHCSSVEPPCVSSQCSMLVNKYLRQKIYNYMSSVQGEEPWLSFVSRESMSLTSPEKEWKDGRRIHLQGSAQSVFLSYVLTEAVDAEY